MARLFPYILIADRNPNVREFLRRELLKDGYRTQIARDGFDLCSILRSRDKPDAVILDPDFPFVEGFVAQELIQQHDGGLPIIFYAVEGETLPGELARCADGIVEKGGDPGELKDVVRRMLLNRFGGDDEPPVG